MSEEIDRKYYSVQQAAEDVGVAKSKLRYWDDEYNIVNKRNQADARKITVKELLVFHKVKTLRKFMNKRGVQAVLDGDIQIQVNPKLL